MAGQRVERKSSAASKSQMLTGDDQSRLALLESKVRNISYEKTFNFNKNFLAIKFATQHDLY